MSHYLNPLIEEAYCVLEGKPLPQELALRLAREIHGCDILDLVFGKLKVIYIYQGIFVYLEFHLKY